MLESALALLIVLFTTLYTLRTRLTTFLSRLAFPSRKTPPWSIPLAVNSFLTYERDASAEVDLMRSAYNKLGLTRRHIGMELGYPAKLNKLRDTNRVNAQLTQEIAKLAEEEYGEEASTSRVEATELGRVREALKHFVRDWGEEGAEERKVIFTPVLDELRKIPEDERDNCSVLVPGAGLGRLAWDISRLGIETTANELSPYMFLSLRFLFSPTTTQKIDQHTVHPHAHWFSHRRTNTDAFRPMVFPDTLPRLDRHFHLLEGDFLDLVPDSETLPIPGLRELPSPSPSPLPSTHPSRILTTPHSSSHIITLFFLDTSPSILATLSQIHRLLRPGGTWINLGPLLWSSGGTTAMELSLEEVLKAVELTGFRLKLLNEGEGIKEDLVEGRSRKIECEYTADKRAMMKWIYEARFWVAEKM